MMEKSVALILAKSDSTRLPNKNTLPVNGEPMFLTNVRKCLKIFDEVYVSSDSVDILEQAMKVGAIPIKRGKDLCGDIPNIPVYRHAQQYMDADIIVAVQANSPTLSPHIISDIKFLMERGHDEVMTCHEDYSIYGSVWALNKRRLAEYDNFYNPCPNVLIVDKSIDIHTKKDYNSITLI